MRLTTRTDLAARVLMFCAMNQGRLVPTPEIATRCNASANHLSQIVNTLQDLGLVQTQRGRAGGVRLARAAEKISMGAMFRDFEASTPFADCFDAATSTCPLHGTCRLRNFLSRAVEAFYRELDPITLDDLVQGNCGLTGLLELAPKVPADCASASRG